MCCCCRRRRCTGRACAFRAQGVPVPRGTTTENLALLDLLLGAHDVEHVVFLGDFLHARAAHAPATLAVLAQWRARWLTAAVMAAGMALLAT
eukprot:gene45749-57006_t